MVKVSDSEGNISIDTEKDEDIKYHKKKFLSLKKKSKQKVCNTYLNEVPKDTDTDTTHSKNNGLQ